MANVYEIIRNYFFPECTACNNRNCVKFFGRLFTCNESKIGFISDWTRPLQIEPWPELGKENWWWSRIGDGTKRESDTERARWNRNIANSETWGFLRFVWRVIFGQSSDINRTLSKTGCTNWIVLAQETDKQAVFYTARPIPIRFLLVLSLFSW